MALIVASVPELTIRTCSTEGTASTTISASSASASVGAPKLVPLAQGRLDGRDDLGMGVAQDQRPHEPT